MKSLLSVFIVMIITIVVVLDMLLWLLLDFIV